MLAAFIDHLWQSLCFAAIAWALVVITRRNSAGLRLWLWRIAAFKFLVPFSLLVAFGGWLGFPVRHTAVPPPAALTQWFSKASPFATPAQTAETPTYLLVMALVFVLIATGACVAALSRQLRRTRQEWKQESVRTDADWSSRPAAPNFLQSVLVTSAALLAFSVPVVAGALEDRLWRQQILAIDEKGLQSASISMKELEPAQGFRSTVVASSQGVRIHNINLKDLVALTYGIPPFDVFGGAMPWLESPRYDVRITGPLHSPAVFDPYSLRRPMTDYLYRSFGVSIRINGACQEPCGKHQSIVIERVPWCVNPISKKPCG